MKALRLHGGLDTVWGYPAGLKGFLVNVNHSNIGRRFIVTAFVFFAIGGILAMLIRAQLATPNGAFVTAETYSQLFTMHGTVMMFLFAIPMLEGVAIYFLPLMLGSRDLAFPRLSAFGWWCYVFGGAMLIASMLLGLAPNSGWFMYTPLSSKVFSPGINNDFWLLGITFVEISAVSAAVELVVSILKFRAPGMSLDRMPIFAWYMLVTAGMIVVGFPPLILGSILLEAERAFGWPFFDPARGGDPLLWQHLFWIFGHPEVYIIFLPGAGIVSTVLPVMARARLLGYRWIVAAIVALGFLSFGLWVHHMYTVGIPHMALGFFSAASALVAIPTGIQIFAWLGTLWSGRPQMKLPMLYLIGFFFVFVIGGLTGVMVAVVPFDWQAHDTHFIVAHMHYVLVGGFIFPLLAGAYYWLAHFTGRQRGFRLGEAAFWLIFVGFNLTFFMMHLTGLLGMPRRVEVYPANIGWTELNLLSSVGGFILGFGFALVVLDVLQTLFVGRASRRNPWRASSLEWAMMLPPPSYNFASQPHVGTRHPLDEIPDLDVRLARGEGYLARNRRGLRETLAVCVADGRLDYLAIVPGNSWLPFVTAVITGLFFLAFLLKLYWAAALLLMGIAAAGWIWARQLGSREDEGPVDIGLGQRARVHHEAEYAPGWCGSLGLLAADATMYGSLLFGFAYLWTIAPNWPPPAFIKASALDIAAGAAGFGGAMWAMRRALAALRRGGQGAGTGWVLTAAIGVIIGALALLAAPVLRLPPPTLHAYAAVAWMLVAYTVFHAAVALLAALFSWARLWSGHVAATRSLELRVARLWVDYAAVAGVIALAVLHVPVLLGAGS